ncbi:capsular polysaccharide biosynthesis protein [Rhizobium puerariae]|uniref:Capsular polysaccharide biosynthesis protein n=1 Tax=Rhizobium puerariae TaxID=1585791 RepID=A0ABV6ALL2_9HYPH
MPDLAGRDVFAFHLRRWKQAILQAYFPQVGFRYLPLYLTDGDFARNWADTIKASARPALLVWGVNAPPAALAFAQQNAIPVYYLEDGFIRSLVPNASHSAPFSLTLDSRAPYFDSRRESDLECLLGSYDFAGDRELVDRAREGIRSLLASRLSKYNMPGGRPAGEVATKTGKRRILVLGQVEDDASIRFGCDRRLTNNDVVRTAAHENPGCEILYKPHPDVLNGVRKRLSNPADVAHLCEIITGPVPLPELLDTTDHVYAITSLGGFEALLRDIPVTIMGCPFYAGWGLTDDRQANPRRNRKLSLAELFAGAYLLYPLYFNPVTGAAISFEECLELAADWRETGMPESFITPPPTPPKPGFRLSGPYGLLGWRHLLTEPLARIIAMMGDGNDAENFRENPILFFRELSNPTFRKVGRVLYPFD